MLLASYMTACGGHAPMSAVATVMANCHPANILYRHEQNEPAGMAGVVWQTAAQVAAKDGDGWLAQLRKTGTGYVVVNCKAAGTAHG